MSYTPTCCDALQMFKLTLPEHLERIYSLLAVIRVVCPYNRFRSVDCSEHRWLNNEND